MTLTIAQNTFLAPAKLNLFLHITGRRSDGYHTLQTIFQLLNWGDTLVITPTPNGIIHCNSTDASLENNAQNLIVKAARALQEHTRCNQGADIQLTKRIPIGGGMGGGSSDAATTLLALNHLWETNLSTDTLSHIGLQLGADVPVFIHQQSAWAEGIGEILTPIALPKQWYVVVHPNCHISTPLLFQHPDLPRSTPKMTQAAYTLNATHNDFENIVRAEYPAVEKAMHDMEIFGTPRLTGTGSCAFIAFDNKTEAEYACKKLSEKHHSFMTEGLKDH